MARAGFRDPKPSALIRGALVGLELLPKASAPLVS
jgi:hypothetical protein